MEAPVGNAFTFAVRVGVDNKRIWLVPTLNVEPDVIAKLFATVILVDKPKVVDATWATVKSKNAIGEVFNIGTGQGTKIIILLDVISQLIGNNKENYVFAPQRKGDINISLASIEKAKRLLQYSPKVDLEHGLKSFIKWTEEKIHNKVNI